MATINIDPLADTAASTSGIETHSDLVRLDPHSFPALTSAASSSLSAAPIFNPPSAVAIQDSLGLERLDRNTFRSKTLWTPHGARGVFGGQVIGQALNAAAKTVGDETEKEIEKMKKSGLNVRNPADWGLHSMHCYFLLPADADIPIIYRVERLRDGKSYTTRAITATQDAKPIFQLSSSFTVPPDFAQPSFSEQMPQGIPMPDQCELEEDRWSSYLQSEKGRRLPPKVREGLQGYMIERRQSPIAIKEVPRDALFSCTSPGMSGADANAPRGADGKRRMQKNERMLWMKAKDEDVGNLDNGFQKCILAYISDFQFVGTAAQSVGLSHASNPQLGMMASLDHVIYFYGKPFSASRWMLHVIESPRTGEGRGVVNGRFYTQEGELIAVTTQEGVVRAARTRGGAKLKPKL